MKNILCFVLLAFLSFSTAQATTIAITPSSLEVITTSAATRTFYDIDAVFIRYKSGKIVVYDAANSTTLFDGDTSETTVTGATHWGAKAAKLALWYQSATTTTGYRFFFPKRGVNLLYKTSTGVVKLVESHARNTLFETHIDSISITGITGASAKLTYFRGQYFLEGLRDRYQLPTSAPTVAAGSAAGSSPTFTVASSGANFRLTYTPGTSPLSSGTICTITLPVTYPNGTILSVRNVDANAKADDAKVLVSSTASIIVFTASTTALTGGAVHTYEIGYAGY